ncbi:hypothetical protein CPB85DRAFT_1338081 [Mucidula mucida]|nr:hypothetical protein CPB85DRAFT_1338081 [Mucidula mucida]
MSSRTNTWLKSSVSRRVTRYPSARRDSASKGVCKRWRSVLLISKFLWVNVAPEAYVVSRAVSCSRVSPSPRYHHFRRPAWQTTAIRWRTLSCKGPAWFLESFREMFDLRFLIGFEMMSLTVNPIPYSRPDPMRITRETKEPDFPEINSLPVSLRHLTIMGFIKTRKEKHKRRLRPVLSKSHRDKKENKKLRNSD